MKIIAGFTMWFFYALLSALFAGFTAIFAKMGLVNVNTNLAMGVRTGVIFLMIWCIVLVRGEAKEMSTLSKQHLLFLGISGVSTGLSWLFYFKALQAGSVSQVVPVDKLSVAIAIILSIIFLKDVLTLKIAIGAGLIIAGTIVLATK